VSFTSDLQFVAVRLNQPANRLSLIQMLGAFTNFLFFSINIELDETGKRI